MRSPPRPARWPTRWPSSHRSRRVRSRTRSTTPSTAWASATRGSTTSWCTSSSATPPRPPGARRRAARAAWKRSRPSRPASPRSPDAMAGPLTGLRVLDLGTRIAAPFCAGLLGEQGAEVVKIEQPGSGDFMREIGPFTEEGYSLFWAVEGRGRRSVTLNLRTPRGQELFRSLAATADVVVENFRPGTLEQWHIAPTELDARLVVVRISSFGQDGPYAPRPGLDRVGIG